MSAPGGGFFGAPGQAVWVLALAAAVLLRWLEARRRAGALRRFTDAARLPAGALAELARRRRWKGGLLLAALALLVAALLRPRLGFRWEEVQRRGVDVMVAVDVSRSMLADDVKPNRLERARREVKDLVRLLRGDRVGLVAFAGDAFVQCPLTLDASTFTLFLDELSPRSTGRGGTALAEALRRVTAGFDPESPARRVAVLITDGEDHEGDLEGALQEAKEKGVVIYALGVGTAEGALIPLAENGSGYLKDREGQVVKSRLDEGTLERIALATGGAYVRTSGAGRELETIYNERIAKLEGAQLAGSRQRRAEERFQWPLGLAVLLLVLEALIGERPPSHTGARSRVVSSGKMSMQKALAILLVLALPAAAGEGPAERVRRANELLRKGDAKEALRLYREAEVDRPGRPELAWNTGIGEFREGRGEEALKAFDAARAPGGGPQVGSVEYQRGVVLDKLGKLDEALEAFRAAVRRDPKDADARFNYEAVQRKLDEQKKQQQQQQQKQPDDQKKEDEKKKDEEKKDEEQKQDEQQKDQEKDQKKDQPEQKQKDGEKKQDGKQDQEKKEGKPAEAQKLTPEEAKRLMERLAREEKEHRMDQIRKAPVRVLPVERDW